MEYKFDVAFSFAGEDREYVDAVAKILKDYGVNVFYDFFEEIDLWGKDLAIHFDYIYRRASRYFVPFISKAYKEKVWTKYEVRTAMARAIQNKEEYILPFHFDDTELEGLRHTIGSINIKNLSPAETASKIMLKLGREQNMPLPEKGEHKDQKSVYLSSYVHVEGFGMNIISLGVTTTNFIKEARYYNAPYFQISKPLIGELDMFTMMEMRPQLPFPQLLQYGQQYQVLFTINSGFLEQLKPLRNQGVTITSYVTTTVGEKYHSNSTELDLIFSLET